ncbi:MAG: carboxypeptidase-like regulatory domain-containing protein, partial [Aureibaculum sp.]
MKKIYFFAALFLGLAISSFAQVTTSDIRGLVVDDQNAPLPGANVVAIHTPTGTKYGGTTNLDGRFNLLNMRVGGPYNVTVSFIGFQS